MLRRALALAGVLALVGTFVPASSLARAAGSSGGRVTAGPPLDYRKVKGLTQPRYKTTRESVEVETKDGINLYLEVVRPKAKGRFGVIIYSGPYHGTLQDRTGTRILPGPVNAKGEHIGLSGYFAPRGYAVVFMDLRGTGRSEGCLDHLGPNDGADLKRVVEWAAKQKWSNGRVGMTGHSYVGSTPMLAAAQNPRGLATIVPSAGIARMYDHKFQDGVPYFLQWAGPLFAYEMLAMDRHLPPGFNNPIGGSTGDNFGNDPQYFGCGWTTSTAVTGDAYLRGYQAQWDVDRDFTNGATKADIPVFIVHGVNDNAARIAAADWFNDRGGRRGDKAWIGQWDHGSGRYPNSRTCPQSATATCENDQWTLALHAWFDKHLLGRNVDTGPAAEVFLNNGAVFTADQWPPRPTQSLILYLNGDGGLAQKPGEEATASYNAAPSSSGSNSVAFESKPFKKETLIIGVPKLRLVASQTSPLLHINATLFDLKGNSADAIGRANWAIQPELREGIDDPQPVIPTEVMEMNLESMAQAHLLEKGHTLRLVVSAQNPDKVPTLAAGGRVTVHLGKKGTRFSLPIIANPVLYRDFCRGRDPSLSTATCV